MDKPYIQEVIVVEGKNDTARLKQFFDCDTIETHGTCLNEYTLKLIARMKEVRGIIVFTDPDAPGNQIRNAVNQAVPGCLNAFIDKKDAKTDKKVGVEHAGIEALKQSLGNLIAIQERPAETISAAQFFELGLMGQPNSSALRIKASRIYHAGTANAKTLRKRLNCLGINAEELRKALKNG